MQATFGEVLLGAVLLAGCGGGAANLGAHETANDSNALVAPGQPEAGPDPCGTLAQYGDDMVASCSYYKKQCVSQRRSNAQSYRLSSPLSYYFPMFQAVVSKDFNGCLQEGARTAQLLGPLPYSTFSDLYGDAKAYALRMIRRTDQRFLRPTVVDRSDIEGLGQVLGADIFAAHLSRTGKKGTIFVYLDLHDNVGIQDAIERSVGELGKRGITLVGAEGVFSDEHLVANLSELQSFSQVDDISAARALPMQDRACFKIAAKNSHVFGVEDSRLWFLQRDTLNELIRSKRSGSNGCETLNRFIHSKEITRWRSYAIAANLVQLMEENHEDAAILIAGALHLADLEEIFDRMDINYMAVANAATINTLKISIEQGTRQNETAVENFKEVCGRSSHRIAVPLTPAATPAAGSATPAIRTPPSLF